MGGRGKKEVVVRANGQPATSHVISKNGDGSMITIQKEEEGNYVHIQIRYKKEMEIWRRKGFAPN